MPIMKKKIIIIGAGIAGLNAGIELLQHGYDVEIYEKNNEVGGLCSGYFVDGCNIDACLHWMMGTKKDTILYNLWKNIDGLNDEVEITHLPYLCSFIYEGTKVTLSRDLDEEEKRWIEISPEDDKAIKIFFSCVRSLSSLWVVTQVINHKKLSGEIFKSIPNISKIIRSMKISRKTYSKRFKHPALRFAIENGLTGYNNMYFFMQVYALFAAGDGDVPFGGAYYMVQRIKNRFLSLGGKLFLNTPINELVVEEDLIKSAKSCEKVIKGDYFVSSTDYSYTLNKLLKGQFQIKKLNQLHQNIKDYSISSCFNIYVKVDDYKDDIDVPTIIKTKEVKVGAHKVNNLLVRPYSFDPTFIYDNNGAVISLYINQNQDDYRFFKEVKDYKKEFGRIINDLISLFEEFYPQYKGKVQHLSSFGPLELETRFNTSYGSIQSFSFSDKGMFYLLKNQLKEISNLYLCGQWNRSLGGTPTALLSSHAVAKKISKRDKNKK